MLQKNKLLCNYRWMAFILCLLLAGTLCLWKIETIQAYVHAGRVTVLRKYEQYTMHRQVVTIPQEKNCRMKTAHGTRGIISFLTEAEALTARRKRIPEKHGKNHMPKETV